jgi:hypothetical protein
MVRVSYFPNWVAEGARGPYHAAPSLMVVVPEQEQVVLEFRNQGRSGSGCSSPWWGPGEWWRSWSACVAEDPPDLPQTAQRPRNPLEQRTGGAQLFDDHRDLPIR